MKRTYLLIALFMMTMLLYACIDTKEEKALTRYEAALLIHESIGFKDYDISVSDIPSSLKNYDEIMAVLARNIFGPTGERYQFKGHNKLTRYDLSRIALGLYAYFETINDHNLEPGQYVVIDDIEHLKPMQKWNVYAAIHHGFLDVENQQYNPNQEVTPKDLQDVMDKVIAKTQKSPTSLIDYHTQKLVNFTMTPKQNIQLNSFIDVYKPSGIQGERLLATSLQGIINRDRISIYIDTLNDLYMFDYANHQGYFSGVNATYTDAYKLLESYISSHGIHKFVVYDSDKPYQINLATDIAAVESRVIINNTMIEKINELVNHPDYLYISSLGITSYYEAQLYAYEHYFPFMRRDMLGYSWYGTQQDFVRDYSIQLKYPMLWIPGSSSVDYDSRIQVLVSDILQWYPANIPLIGFQYAHSSINGVGMDMGIGEFTGVNLAGEYGKYTAVFDSVGNLSFYSHINVPEQQLRQTYPEKERLVYDSQKKYVALTMTESGDSPAYIQYGLRQRQWSDITRGSIPYNYSYGLINTELLPLHTSYFFSTMTENDEFFGAISGLGYNYPMISYGSKGVKNEDGIYMLRDDIMKDHYMKANIILQRINFKAMSIYSYPGDLWGVYDYIEMDEMVFKYLTYADTIVADMHRPQNLYNSNPVKETAHGQVLFHGVTFWSLSDLGSSYDYAKDNLAINYLVNEIVSNTQNNGNFFQAMAYSWHFGPRRLKLVIDEIERLYPGVYVFVNISELNDLYYQSKS